MNNELQKEKLHNYKKERERKKTINLQHGAQL